MSFPGYFGAVHSRPTWGNPGAPQSTDEEIDFGFPSTTLQEIEFGVRDRGASKPLIWDRFGKTGSRLQGRHRPVSASQGHLTERRRLTRFLTALLTTLLPV